MSYTPLTLLDIKKGVSAQLGKSDYATPNSVRDIKINDARREVYASTRWSFLRKNQTLTFMLSSTGLTAGLGVCPFPDLLAPSDDPITLYEYPVLGQKPLKYSEVFLESVASYIVNGTSQKVYAIDIENSQFVSNQTTATPNIAYISSPKDRALDGSEDALVEPASKAALTAIVLLATAEYWLASERDEDEYDRFFARYEKQLAVAQLKDSRVGPQEKVATTYQGVNMGFNKGRI